MTSSMPRLVAGFGSVLRLTFALVGTACRGDRGDPPLVASGAERQASPRSTSVDVAGSQGRVNLYAATGADDLAPVARRARPLVYVPDSRSASVSSTRPLMPSCAILHID